MSAVLFRFTHDPSCHHNSSASMSCELADEGCFALLLKNNGRLLTIERRIRSHKKPGSVNFVSAG